MDPERQPLLQHRCTGVNSEGRCRALRPLTPEEVQSCRKDRSWRRIRIFLVVIFWAIMAMFLSSIASILLQAPRCPTLGPSVPPVHLNLAPLMNIQDVDKKEGTWMT